VLVEDRERYVHPAPGVQGFRFRVSHSGFLISGFKFLVSGFGVRVSGFGFWVSDFGSTQTCPAPAP
jgi:hypothetical protein